MTDVPDNQADKPRLTIPMPFSSIAEWSESFHLTPGLRFKAGLLQQLWQGSRGTHKWQDVPSVDEGGD